MPYYIWHKKVSRILYVKEGIMMVAIISPDGSKMMHTLKENEGIRIDPFCAYRIVSIPVKVTMLADEQDPAFADVYCTHFRV